MLRRGGRESGPRRGTSVGIDVCGMYGSGSKFASSATSVVIFDRLSRDLADADACSVAQHWTSDSMRWKITW